jgi:hypothetical protein
MIASILRLTVLSAALLASPLAAQQPKPLNVDMTNGWTHPQSGLSFPKEMVALPFFGATEFADGGWDLALQYGPKGLSEAVSVYVYQAAVQDVGMLFSESRNSLEMRKQVYGEVTALAPVASFTPPGQGSASGLRITYSTTGAYPTTALAIAPLGRDWVVKFRVSSKTKTAAELDATLTEAINMLGWPEDKAGHPVAAETSDCPTVLPFFEKAKRVKDDGASAILNAALFGLVSEKAEEADEAATEKSSYCRDRSVPFELGIYRPDAATDRYLVSLGDSGRALFVEPDIAAALLDDNKKGKTTYTVRFVGPGSVAIFPAHDRMPSPQQAFEILNSMAPVSTTGRSKEDKTVTIGPDALK